MNLKDIDKPNCPTCGMLCSNMTEEVLIRTMLFWDENDEADLEAEEIFWDTSEPHVTTHGIELGCPAGHAWFSHITGVDR